MGESEQRANGLSFRFKEDGKTLEATFTPGGPQQAQDSMQIRALLAEQGLLNLFLFESALAECARKAQTATEPFVLDIGERRDGTVAVAVTPDKMTASITIAPPYGGHAVDQEMVFGALTASGVVSGIAVEEIESAVRAGEVHAKAVARGRAPVNGAVTEFEPLVSEMKGLHPHVDEHGIADYRDLGLFVTVKQGQPLMRRVPPTPGVPGENVMGQMLPA
ncbi:MAG: hypothetical protein H6R26_1557, partial [Proteobacteria bacterium]|nr:hypothetical protein [Pseudomonadota bacterium]